MSTPQPEKGQKEEEEVREVTEEPELLVYSLYSPWAWDGLTLG